MKKLITPFWLLVLLANAQVSLAQPYPMWVPLETRATTQDNTVTLVAPNEWTYLGRKADGTILKGLPGTETKISCDCKSSGQCAPFYATGGSGTSYGCSTTDCTECLMKVTVKSGGIHHAVTEGAYVRLAQQVRFAEVGEQLPEAKRIMFDDAETLGKLSDFLREIYGTQTMPDLVQGQDGSWSAPIGYKLAGINWCGRGVIAVVPDEAGVPGGGGTTATCSCDNGTCTLDSTSIWGVGKIYNCISSCTGTCTLTITQKSAPGEVVNEFTWYKY